MKTILLAVVLAAFAAASTNFVIAADKPVPAEKAEAKARALPFQGKLDAVDQQAKTIKIGQRLFHVTAETKITKDASVATLADAKVGDQVGLSYRRVDDKTLNLVSLRIGPKTELKKEESK
ncbi:MAG TPA: hypothetical protein VK530_01315 [Candidatus Acidoferrum sp.]|nr:hypothetical protein [Candidatus Acidoferrum sp.]